MHSPLRFAILAAAIGYVCCSAVASALNSAQLADCLAKHYPPSAGFFGAMGAASALVFANLGSAYGTAKSGCGVAHLGLSAPERIMRGIVPVVMAGILGIYGLIIAVIINNNINPEDYRYSAFAGYLHLGAGMAAGFSALGAGLAIGIVGDSSVRAYAKQEQIFVAMILMLIFGEALGLYGLIIALLMNNQANKFANACVGSG
jgi:V-type H+-transporting ATPase proteolipid subunit